MFEIRADIVVRCDNCGKDASTLLTDKSFLPICPLPSCLPFGWVITGDKDNYWNGGKVYCPECCKVEMLSVDMKPEDSQPMTQKMMEEMSRADLTAIGYRLAGGI